MNTVEIKSGEIKARSTAKGKQDILLFDPKDLTLVDDKESALYDERVHNDVDDAMVKNIMAHGVLEPVIVRRNGETEEGPVLEVVDGRQRVKNALEANKRFEAEGKEPILIPAILRRGEDADVMGVMISANEIRKADTPIVKAKKLQRYINMGRSEEQAAVMFGVHVATVKNMLSLLDCHSSVQKAVEAGTITATMAAKEFAKMPRNEQKEALEKMIEAGATKGKKGAQALKSAKGDKEAATSVIPSKPKLKHFREAVRELEVPEDDEQLAVVKTTALQVLGFILDGKKLGGKLGAAWKSVQKE